MKNKTVLEVVLSYNNNNNNNNNNFKFPYIADRIIIASSGSKFHEKAIIKVADVIYYFNLQEVSIAESWGSPLENIQDISFYFHEDTFVYSTNVHSIKSFHKVTFPKSTYKIVKVSGGIIFRSCDIS